MCLEKKNQCPNEIDRQKKRLSNEAFSREEETTAVDDGSIRSGITECFFWPITLDTNSQKRPDDSAEEGSLMLRWADTE